MLTRTVALNGPADLALTLGPLQHGRRDPTTRVAAGEAWRATRTPDGPATIRVVPLAPNRFRVDAWGRGADHALEHAPGLLGAADDPAAFAPADRRVAEWHRRFAGLRFPRITAVAEALVPVVLEQKVQTPDAHRSWAIAVRLLGDPAPGPAPLWLPPSPETLAATPYFALRRAGIERRRADVLRRIGLVAPRIDDAAALPLAAARARLRAIPGVGPWTAAEVAMRALGDADAVPVGDYHLPNHVAWALARDARADDARMVELLEPFRPHRARVIRLLLLAGTAAPRFGPRLPYPARAAGA